MSINLLTIPMLGGGLSHQIPLFVLNQLHLQRIEGLTNYFLLPNYLHESFSRKNIKILPFDYGITDIVRNDSEINTKTTKAFLEIETKAFELAKPNVVVEDCCFTSPLVAEKKQIPRISIQRTGFFRTIDKSKRNRDHKHSLEGGANLSFLKQELNGNSQSDVNNNFLSKYLNSTTKIIPGIPTIERLPDNIGDEDSFFYSGPLLLNDNLSDQDQLNDINKFLEFNIKRKKVFITAGLISQVNIIEFINVLLERDYAVITTSNVEVPNHYNNIYLSSKFFPLNFLCSKMDLVIHQCGSGMYHYPIINKKPTITIGTRCYDREDIALRLEELNISKHVPNSKDNINYMKLFNSYLTDFENSEICDFEVLNQIHDEIFNCIKNFNPIKVLEHAISNLKK